MTIKQVQCLLTYLGYDPGAIDGVNGKNTMAAVRAFQAQEGLDPDGVPGGKTWAALLDAVAQGREYDPGQSSTGGETAKTGTFWDDIEYFTREEFRCQCGGKYCNGFPAEMSEDTVRCSDEIRRRAGIPLRVNSGLRCERWNREKGGETKSYHMTGHAVDLFGNISPRELLAIAEEVQAEMLLGRGGLGLYDWGIHEDDGPKRRWNG